MDGGAHPRYGSRWLRKVSKLGLLTRAERVEELLGVGVRVEPDESFERTLRRFKKACEKAGLLGELRRRQSYTPPSARRRAKRRRAVARQRRRAARPER